MRDTTGKRKPLDSNFPFKTRPQLFRSCLVGGEAFGQVGCVRISATATLGRSGMKSLLVRMSWLRSDIGDGEAFWYEVFARSDELDAFGYQRQRGVRIRLRSHIGDSKAFRE